MTTDYISIPVDSEKKAHDIMGITRRELTGLEEILQGSIEKCIQVKETVAVRDELFEKLYRYVPAEKKIGVDSIYSTKITSMVTGKTWEKIIALFMGITPLYGHKSGCDLVDTTNKKVVVELKNSHNTDNSSSRKQNHRKLAKYAAENNLIPIYGVINEKAPHNSGLCKDIPLEDKLLCYSDGTPVVIKYMSSDVLFKFLTGHTKGEILEVVNQII